MTALERSIKRDLGFGDIMRDPKKKRAKKDTRKAADKYADDMFSLYIRARDKTCVTSGVRDVPCKGSLQCSHVERRGRHATRYMEINAYVQCESCHAYHHTQSESPLREYVLLKIGQEAMTILYRHSRTTCKRTPEQLREIGRDFSCRVREMA